MKYEDELGLTTNDYVNIFLKVEKWAILFYP